MLRCLICLFFLFVENSPLQAASVDYSIFEDKAGVVDIDSITNQQFSEINKEKLSFGYSSSVYWLRMQVKNSDKKLLLKSCYTQINDLTVVMEESGPAKIVMTGDLMSFKSREIEHPCFVFSLTEQKDQTIYIRAQTTGPVNLPFEIVTEDYFWHDNMSTQLAYGFYFAILLAMIVYNLFLFFIIRDPSYLFYVGYLGGIVFFLASMTGHAAMYLWPNSPQWANISAVSFAVLAICSGLQFVKHMSNINEYSRTVSKCLNIVSFVALAVIPLLAFDFALASKLTILIVLISVMLFFISIIISLRNHWKPSYFLLVGLIVLFPGIIMLIGQTIGWLETNWWTRNALHIGTAIEAMLLSFALAYRIRILNDELDIHRQQAISMQSQFSRSLIEAKDHEQRSLARELHDGVAQSLLAIKGKASRLTDSDAREQISLQIKQSLSEIRSLSKKMHPQQLDTLGLATAVESMFKETLQPYGIQVETKAADVSGLLDKDTELHLFRIAQECLNNIVKHSDANIVRLSLATNGKLVCLSIEDDGVGIINSKKGMGMINIKERSKLINADLTIQSQAARGTKIVVDVPCQ